MGAQFHFWAQFARLLDIFRLRQYSLFHFTIKYNRFSVIDALTRASTMSLAPDQYILIFFNGETNVSEEVVAAQTKLESGQRLGVENLIQMEY